MEIQFIKPTPYSVPIPLIDDGHSIHIHLAEFLVRRWHYPQLINDKMKSMGSMGSLRQLGYNLKRFLEDLAANNINYLDADYAQIKAILIAECEGHTNHATFNTKLTAVRTFYEYIDSRGIFNKASFPDTIATSTRLSDDDNLLSHTSSKRMVNYNKDPDHQAVQQREDYTDRVFSVDQYGQLYNALHKIDPVYAVMAQVMTETYLRISNVCEVAFRKDKRNKRLLLWPEMRARKLTQQKMYIKAKGNKVYAIPLYEHTSKAMYEDYIKLYYEERKKLYEKNVKNRKNASLHFNNGSRELPDDVLWFTRKGFPVKPNMLRNAFKKTGLNIDPHSCRHSGVTHTLWNFCEINEIEVTDVLAGQFKKILQKLLGHASIETTQRYINTIQEKQVDGYMPFCIPTRKPEIDSHLKEHVKKDVMGSLQSFFGDVADVLTDDIDVALLK